MTTLLLCSLARHLFSHERKLRITNPQTPQIMCNFINDYPAFKVQALELAFIQSKDLKWAAEIDEESIYAQIASPEFRLYEEMIFCDCD